MTFESREHRLKRLRMRSMRRGIKEMDLALTAFAEARLAGLSDTELDLYEALLQEPDQDIFLWLTGRAAAPDRFAGMMTDIAHVLQQKVKNEI
ncbi:succinate dehydrogenase assembly factor 2 [Jhaorihella thermophila]|uniref:FAD assembly factor SdhE n=1 Tax=Jhaorihella thermophila TaxID=488547 RepID=A0A1H5T4I9_9RHOB|nr:succinate dehydrogenase assembly factor 2 [Jhaorihella thermophila]SEF57685.1 antitoxin CptB [Jhaorihella thermophila]